jgi:hypothetical protein
VVAAELEWPPGGESEALPSWLVVTLVTALCALVGFGTVGLALAVLGVMAPASTLGLGALVTIALVVALAPWRTPAARDGDAQVPALLAVALVAGAVVFAMAHHAQHVLLDRDPGGYVLTGRWLATHHSLAVPARVGAFKHATGLTFASPAMFTDRHGTLSFQFSHLLPVYLAQARWIGGDRLMFLAPALLGGIGLLAFYALATRFVRPWIAVGAVAALATNLVESHFMRDAYSELPTQAVLLGALWLLTRRGTARPVVAGFTGLLLGATVMARIDGPLYVVVVAFVIGAAVIARRRGDADGRALVGAAAWLTVGTALTTALGYLDVSLRSSQYLQALAGSVNLQYLALALACVGAVALGVFAPKLFTRPARAFGGRLADAAGLATGAAFVALWVVRPRVQHTRGAPHPETAALQLLNHVKRDPYLSYYEHSMQWQAWYVGALALAAGIVGVAFLVREIVGGRGGRRGLFVVAFLPVTAAYLWNPRIFPDQLWVMRRYLPIVLPGFVLFAFVVVELLWSRFGAAARGRSRIGLRAAAGALAFVAIAWPSYVSSTVRGERTEAGFLGAVNRVCDRLGADAAVVVLGGGAPPLEQVLPQTLRSFCDVPVALPSRTSRTGPFVMHAADFTKLAADWKRAGRTLFVVGDSTATIRATVPGAEPAGEVDAVNRLFLQERLVVRPNGFRSEVYRFVIARVPTR